MSFQLAIDIGNSRTKFGLFNGDELLYVTTTDNNDLDQADDIIAEYEIKAIIVSSVNESAEKMLHLADHTSNLVRLSHQTPLPITLAYETPTTLGKDRIASVVGAEKRFPNTNILAIDAGSCITYDFLTADKVYIGGAISPGIQMRRSHNYTFNSYKDQTRYGA